MRRRRLLVTSALGTALMGLWVVLTFEGPRAPGDRWGTAFGAAAALLLVFDATHVLRRRLVRWPVATAAQALAAHVAAGFLVVLLVGMHIGFRPPAGWLGWLLLILLAGTTLSGIIGRLVQRVAPRRLADLPDANVPAAGMPDIVARLRREADALGAECSPPLRTVFDREIAPVLHAGLPTWPTVLRDLRREERLAALERVIPFLQPDDRTRAAALASLLAARLDLDLGATWQRALGAWLWVHVPAAALLIVCLAWHVLAVWYW